ncbi:MAG: NAD(P)H-quinone oxidoreductase [Acidimicrobiales bacterium]
MMKAVVLESYGGPEVLTVGEVPEPHPGPEELLIQVRTTALNRADLLQRQGFYPGPAMAHEIPGMEFSGTVVGVGERVVHHQVGDEVMGIVGGGAYAELLAVHERQVMPVPSSVGVADGAAIPEVWITAFDALVVQAGLTSGLTALVHAGGSGVGTAAIQIAKAIGARIAVTASPGKLEACTDLGADLAIDYTTENYAERIMELTNGVGADVILDVIGGDYLAANLTCVRTKGTIIQVGMMGSTQTEIDLGRLLTGRIRLIGTVLRARPIEEKVAITQQFSREILPLFDRGQLRPVISTRFALEDIQSAHEMMESNANVGKILVDVS